MKLMNRTELILERFTIWRDLAKNNNNNKIITLICLAKSVRAKVLRDPLVQYSRGLNWFGSIDELAALGKGRGSTETPV